MVSIKCSTGKTIDLKVTQGGVEIEDIFSIDIKKIEPNEPILATIEVIVDELDIIAEETIKPIKP